MRKAEAIFLLLIIILAAVLRIGWLGRIPPSLSWDEAAIGYNAWSILKTGRDEYGASLPLTFRSFDDAKQPVAIYLAALSEKIFGLNEFSVRFPSALLGTLTVLLVYYLVNELFCCFTIRGVHSDTSEEKLPFNNDSPRRSRQATPPRWSGLPLIAAFLLAISPWHINFSRGAFETNISLFFFAAGLLFLFKGLKKPILFNLAAVSFIFSIYSYYTTRIIIPLVLLVFAFVYRKKLLSDKKWLIISAVLGGLLILPLFKQMVADNGLARMGYVSIFTHQKDLVESYAQEILRNNNSWRARIFYNRRLAYFLTFANNYLKSFSPDFLFINGVEMSGLFYLWQIIFLPIGLVKIFELKKKWKWIILAWFFSAPIAGGLSIGAPNPFRNLPNVAVMTIFSAYGLATALEWFKKKRIFYLGASVLGAVIVFSFFRFCLLYFDYTPPRQALHWGDGYKQLAYFLEKEKDGYDLIWVSGDYWRPYIHLLFHLKYPPEKYQKEGSPAGFDIFKFGKADWDPSGVDLKEVNLSKLAKGKTLFILSRQEYQAQRKKNDFSWQRAIDGQYEKAVFRAVEL